MSILIALSLLCGFYLVFPFAISLVSVFIADEVTPDDEATPSSNFACIITAYKDLDIAWPLVRSLLSQRYPHFHVYLVADVVENPTAQLFDSHFSLLIPPVPLHSKVASLDYALTHLAEGHSHVVVFDPDNLVPDHFLSVLDRYHQAGFDLVQGKRIAKNIDTTYAALDALGEYYYDYAVRKALYQLGSSSTIAGSGMSVRLDLYQDNIAREMEEFKEKGVVVSEDKSLQLQMVSNGFRIAYAGAAIIFDEKISAAHQIGKQRGRWLNSYFRHSLQALVAFGKGVMRADWNAMLFSVAVLMPPMVVLMALTFFLMVLGLIVKPVLSLALLAAAITFVMGFLGILVLNRAPRPVRRAIPQIPLFVMGQISGFLKIKKANKDFMATEHSYLVEIDDVWAARKREFRYLSHWWTGREA
ncbi:MAG: glycosyltransferase [Lunatimonas sp.]|uniref:glycosyltransferase n=1 Tax=Lunatimonas sp. TaxID=2060141 RepID=UPI00263A7FB5|nr:glycosyltransferase [Lunatimonas sp.]MCC5935926.1 glycosyltransferase [Lunatimonas sp.]